MALVSIIIPVYNAEKYISVTIQSILNQTFKDIELILVNDGSSDNSGQICEEYAKIDERVCLINKKNEGPSIARNIGIKAAKAKYIQFVDSDDVIELSTTQKLVDCMEQYSCDMVLFGYYMSIREKEKIKDINSISMPSKLYKSSKEFALESIPYLRKWLINSLWSKLYRADIIKNNNILFNKDYILGEDLLFNCEYLKYVGSLYNLDESLYHYISNEASLTKKNYDNIGENQRNIYSKFREFLINHGVYNGKLKEDFCGFYLSFAIISSIQKVCLSMCNNTIKHEKILNIINDDLAQEVFEFGKPESSFHKLLLYMIKQKSLDLLVMTVNLKKLIKR